MAPKFSTSIIAVRAAGEISSVVHLDDVDRLGIGDFPRLHVF
ncbi:MAG: hypothetical protein ABSG31_18975 [Tepidisphaeraceae bacterium]